MTVGNAKTGDAGVAMDIYTAWSADPDASLRPSPLDSPVRNMLGAQINAIAAAIAAGSGTPLSPFHFRLDPTSTAQFGTGRAASGGTAPTVSALVDSYGQPFVRFTANSANASAIPLLVDGSPLVLTGAFLIEMRALWQTGYGAGQRRGIGFNLDPSGTSCFAVTNRTTDGNFFDANTNGANENLTTVGTLANVDASYRFPTLWCDVWLSLSPAGCHYRWAPARDFGSFWQLRKTTLAHASGTQVGLYSVANTGYLDVYTLDIWKPGRSW